MTAPIVYHYSRKRRPVSDLQLPWPAVPPMKAWRTCGQLWERLAEMDARS